MLQAGGQPVRSLAVMGECYMWALRAKKGDVEYKLHLQYLEADGKLTFQSLLQMQGTNQLWVLEEVTAVLIGLRPVALRLASVTELRRFQNKTWAVVLGLALRFCPLLSAVVGVAVAVHWLKALYVLNNPLLVTFVQISPVTQSWVWSPLHSFEESLC